MKSIILACLVSITLTQTNTLSAQDNIVTVAASVAVTTPIVSQFTCSIKNDRVLLSWVIENNQSANQVEVESSTDGKNFSMAALVFGTEKKDSDNYYFYEKAKKAKIFYRLKVINKDSSVQYSAVITP